MGTALAEMTMPQISPLAGEPIERADAERLAGVLKALADPARLRLLSLIQSSTDGERFSPSNARRVATSSPMSRASNSERETKRSPVTGCVATRLPDGGQEALRLRLLGATPAERSRTKHLNGDRLDFRRANLLLKDGSEHFHGGRKMRRTGQGQVPTSRFKGVCWRSGEGTWAANIMKDGVARRLGRFDDEIAAAQAYDEAARELYGPLAYQNFADGVDARLEREAVEVGVATAEGGTEAPATARAA